ncbi:MAG TPA: hypothetical protein DCR71_01625 [Dehalococcoidia bacterium]|nr:hypothetical protein [Dehalococcoidia bacterium]
MILTIQGRSYSITGTPASECKATLIIAVDNYLQTVSKVPVILSNTYCSIDNPKLVKEKKIIRKQFANKSHFTF